MQLIVVTCYDIDECYLVNLRMFLFFGFKTLLFFAFLFGLFLPNKYIYAKKIYNNNDLTRFKSNINGMKYSDGSFCNEITSNRNN